MSFVGLVLLNSRIVGSFNVIMCRFMVMVRVMEFLLIVVKLKF